MTERGTTGQLALCFHVPGQDLAMCLRERLAKPVSLTLTDNASSLLSASSREGVLNVRLHRMFLSASSVVIDEIASFLKGRRGKMPLFRAHVREHRECLGRKKPNRVAARTEGRFHDLRALFDAVNSEYFEGRVRAVITWGSRSPRCAVRRRTLGSYSERSNTIRINPVLDKKTVPRYYIAFIVFHEMLHADIGIVRNGNRRSIHSREFRQRERLFREYGKALAWERGSEAPG